jgi:hypothetical protein
MSGTDSYKTIRQQAVSKAEENYRSAVALAKAAREAAEKQAIEGESDVSQQQNNKQAIALARQVEKDAIRLAETVLKAAVFKAMQDEMNAQKKARAESAPAPIDPPPGEPLEVEKSRETPVPPQTTVVKEPRLIQSELLRLRESLMDLVSATSVNETEPQFSCASAVGIKAPAEVAAPSVEEVVKSEAEVAPHVEEVVKSEAEVAPHVDKGTKAKAEANPHVDKGTKAKAEAAPHVDKGTKAKAEAAPHVEKGTKAKAEAAPHVEVVKAPEKSASRAEKAPKPEEKPAPQPVVQADPHGRIKVSISRVTTAKQLLEVENALRGWPGVKLIMSVGGGVDTAYYISAEDPSLLAGQFQNLSIVENASPGNGGLSVILKTETR